MIPEQVIRGRLVDVNGQPAAGVEVGLNRVYRATPPAGARFDSPIAGRGFVWSNLPEGLRAWPKSGTSDGQGRFTLTGGVRGLDLSLAVRDPRFAQQRIELRTDKTDGPKEVAAALHPSTIIEGRVLAAGTGRPIPDAVISVRSSYGLGGGMVTTKSRVSDWSTVSVHGKGYLIRKDFTVKAGETVDLGDILVEKPEVVTDSLNWLTLPSSRDFFEENLGQGDRNPGSISRGTSGNQGFCPGSLRPCPMR